MAIDTNFSNILKPNFGTNPVVFFKEVWAELRKVSWPTKTELFKLTFVVIAVSVIVGIYLGGLDFGFTKLMEAYLLKRR